MGPDRNRSTVGRRRFVLGVGSVSVGGAAVLGSGALSRGEPQRTARIESAADTGAYLGLVFGDVDLESCEETVELLELTNQFKVPLTDVTLTVSTDDGLEISDLVVPEGLSVGETATVPATVDCSEPGTTSTVEFLVEVDGTEIALEADRPKRHLDDIEIRCPANCPEVPQEGAPEPFHGTGISFVAFCRQDGTAVDVDRITVTHVNDDEEPTGISWATAAPIDEVVLKCGQEWYRYDYPGGEADDEEVLVDAATADDVAETEPPETPPFRFESDGEPTDAVRSPSSPWLVGGTKIEHGDGFDV